MVCRLYNVHEYFDRNENLLIDVPENPFWFNSSDYNIETEDSKTPTWYSSYDECPLMDIDTFEDKIRIIGEIILLLGAFAYLLAALRESRFLGYKMFVENLVCNLFPVQYFFFLIRYIRVQPHLV